MPRLRKTFAEPPRTPEVNLSPLIDMVFILLIFFIVTTVFVEETGIDINKPTALSARDLEQQSILIAIEADGSVHFGGREIGVAGVRAVVRRLLQDESQPVIVQADEEVPTRLLVRVIDEANLAGATAVSVATRQ